MYLFAADTHLSLNTWKSLPAVKGDSYRSFEQIINHAINNKAEAVILGGDIFDGTPIPDDVECFLRGARRLKENNIKVLAIQGQHARSGTIPWTSIDPYVYWLCGSIPWFELNNGVRIAGFDNMPINEIKESLKKLDHKVNVVVLHQTCRGSVPDNQERWDFDPDWVPSTVRLVLMGDIHTPWETAREVKVGGKTLITKFIYSGSTCMRTLNEKPDKSFLEVEGLEARRISLQTRPFFHYQLLDDRQVQKAMSEISNVPPDSLVFVKHDPRIEKVEERIKSANAQVHLVFRPIPVTIEGNTTFDPESIKSASLEACLDSLIDSKEDAEFYSFMLVLLKSKKPKDSIQEFRKKTVGE